MNTPINLEQRAAWIAEYVRGEASPEVIRHLEEALQSDPYFRDYFLEYLNVDGALGAMGAFRLNERVSKSGEGFVEGDRGAQLEIPVRGKPGRWFAWGGGAAAAAVLFGVGLWGLWFWQPGGYATVHGSVGAELVPGTQVRGGRLRFEKGAVEFVTTKGARVVVEAPADIRFESRDCLRVFRGKVAADVPERARGFTVQTPDGGAVDLGTRFGVDVSGKGGSEVHVFEGEVITQAKGETPKRSLRTGEATTLARGNMEARGLRSASFIQSGEFAELAAGWTAAQRQRSASNWTQILADPSLIAAFDFEGDQQLEGVCSMAQGRWPGSRAPEFVNVGDHLKVEVGAGKEYPRLTLAAWVRLDRLGEPYQSLYHTDGWTAETPGQVHWMLTAATTMRLALRGNTLVPGAAERDSFPDSITPVLPEQGRWVHLATVYDSEAKRVRFYLNGRFDSETLQQVAWPARLGPARIGNWNRTDRKLSGRVDELVFLGRALSDAEVQDIYECGSPYR